jgi:hypothetical protein
MATIGEERVAKALKRHAPTSLVEAVLELDEWSMDYRITLEPDQAAEWARRVGGYNAATSCVLAGLVKAINKIIPPMNFKPRPATTLGAHLYPEVENPNNGKPHHKFRVGREGSRVVYVSIARRYLTLAAEPQSEADYEKMKSCLIGVGRNRQADEVDVVEESETGLTIRYWWD